MKIDIKFKHHLAYKESFTRGKNPVLYIMRIMPASNHLKSVPTGSKALRYWALKF